MIHSFLLIGQSNMAGRGLLSEAEKIDTKHIKVLRNGRWQRMYRPVNPDRSFSGVCLAESFAEMYAAKYGVDVGLIPAADGGTSAGQWKEGSLLFDNAIYQARLAMRTSTIAGVLWHQGESDRFPDRIVPYKDKLIGIIEAFKKELDLYDVPFLLGGLGDYLADCRIDEYMKNCSLIDAQIREVASEMPMVGYVSAKGLTSNEDFLHFNAKSLYEFGHRYFDEFEKLRDPNKIFEDKPNPDDALRTALELL